MLKTKFILPLFAMVLVLGLSNAAFAQLSCNVASTPVSRATDTGLTEPAGDLIFNCTAGGTATTTASMTIDYGVPITNTTAYPAGKPISITNVTGFTGGAVCTVACTPSIAAVTNATGQIVINIPAQSGTVASSFTLTGTLLALAGSGKTSDVANVSVSPGNNVLITAGQTTAVVVTSILPGITAPTITKLTTAGLILGPGVTVPAAAGGFSIDVKENYIDMFRSLAQFNGGFATQGVQLLYTFSGIPTGITLSGAGSSTTPCTTTMTTGTAGIVSANGTLTSTNNTLTVEITGTTLTGPSLTAIDTLTLACPLATIGSTATLPLTPGTITATVTLAPTGAAFSSTGTVLTAATTGQIPRYISNPLPTPALTVVNIVPAATDMLFPFVSIGNGFDTGFAIANTTGDPFGGTKNGGASPQSGTVTVYFFPTTGSSFCLSTGGTATNPVAGGTGSTTCATLSSSSVGQGLSSGGLVAPGSSWIVLGSEMFKNISGAPAVFNGYAFAVANFTNAHPTSFVADAAFSGKFASGGPALVLAAPAITARTGAGAGVESLGH